MKTRSLSTRSLIEEGGGECRPTLQEQRLNTFGGERRQLVLERPGAQLERRTVRQRTAPEREAARLAYGAYPAGVEAGIVGAHRAHAYGDRVDARPQLVHEAAAFLA